MTSLRYCTAAALNPRVGLSEHDLIELAPRLEAARTETLDDLRLWHERGEVPPEKQPLDAAFIDLPDRLLADYEADRSSSEIQRILDAARRFADAADRLVLLGIGGSYMGARALWEACCHPYWNELSRAERGSRPRIYFEGNNLDNDAVQGLLDLVVRGRGIEGGDDRWGIVVISKSGGTLETGLALRVFLSALERHAPERPPLVIPVTGPGSRLEHLTRALGCRTMFEIPEGVGGRFSVFSAVGLLPAAILGLDIVRLLRGAAAMNEHFRAAPWDGNIVLRHVGVSHLAEQRLGCGIRVLSTWGKNLEAVGLWYDQLLAESLGKQERGATPLSVVNTRDLHSRGQQHQQGRRDKLITNLIVDECRRDRLIVERSPHDYDQLNALAGRTVPEILSAAIEGTNRAYAADGRPTVDVRLPRSDEASLGELLQMLMLATVVEGRLIGVNPYGQPGVEDYKRHMREVLSRDGQP